MRISDWSSDVCSSDLALPVSLGEKDRPGVLLIARETTLEQNLTKALVESRQMFKDLLACSADFAWATDSNGVFRYEIGRASCRARVCQYVKLPVVPASLKQKQKHRPTTTP